MVIRIPLVLFLSAPLLALPAQEDAPREEDYYRIETYSLPDDVVLEVGGLALLPDGRPLVSTRRGQVFVVDDAYAQNVADASFGLFLDGLQEPLGLLMYEGWIYCVQRGELSRFRDVDGDDRADELETICDEWPISGNYHEYSFGPRLGPDGNFWMTTNKPFGAQPFGRAKWRGFALRITPEGEMLPTCCGLRSPAGIEVSPWGDAFYTDNQGEWCGASKLSHLEPGDFHGHVDGLFGTEDPRWTYGPKPAPPNGELMPLVGETVPSFKLPAVWFPYDKMGKSPSGMVWDQTEGAFGPFAGQLFVGDQFHAWVMRVFLERVEGHWQGACFPFRSGFQCGIIRVAFGADDSLLVGESNRGWGSRGSKTYGLERLSWTGETPFEIHSMRARPEGFSLTFTQPAEDTSAADPASYRMESYTYLLHSDYGSPEVEKVDVPIESVQVAPDGLTVTLTVSGLRPGFVHELHADGLRSRSGTPLLHPQAYYTLVRIPAE